MLPGMAARDRDDALAHARLAEQAWTASRRMISRGERPGYRVAETGDGITVHVVELPWLGRMEAGLSRLGEKRGVMLCQLPPHFPRDLDRLDRFLGLVPSG